MNTVRLIPFVKLPPYEQFWFSGFDAIGMTRKPALVILENISEQIAEILSVHRQVQKPAEFALAGSTGRFSAIDFKGEREFHSRLVGVIETVGPPGRLISEASSNLVTTASLTASSIGSSNHWRSTGFPSMISLD